MMEITSKTLLLGDTPRLIDEWQTIPELWDTIRNEVDKRGTFSQFILTGSTVAPQADETTHSGTGRIGRVKMRPMSLFESGESSGSVSLKNLFDGETFEPQPNHIDLQQMAYLTCRGGWPSLSADMVARWSIGSMRVDSNISFEQSTAVLPEPYPLPLSECRNILGVMTDES